MIRIAALLQAVCLTIPYSTLSQVKCHACVGGTSVREDARILSAGVHVVVGTPGRVFDMLRRRCLRADSIKMFVLDEADEMLSRGFKDQIYDIFQLLPPKLQVCNTGGYFSSSNNSLCLLVPCCYSCCSIRLVENGQACTAYYISQTSQKHHCSCSACPGWCVLCHPAP